MPTSLDTNVELRDNNPYSIGSIMIFEEGDVLLDPGKPQFPKTQLDRYYVVEEPDDIWTIAHKAYGNSKWYWVILYANNIDFAFDITTGQTLLIPDLNTFKVTSL